MLLYCLKCRKNTENKNPKVLNTKSRIRMLLSICPLWDSEKSKFIKEKEDRRLLGHSSLIIRSTALTRIIFFM